MRIKIIPYTVKDPFCMLSAHVTEKKAVAAVVNVLQLVAIVTIQKLLLMVTGFRKASLIWQSPRQHRGNGMGHAF